MTTKLIKIEVPLDWDVPVVLNMLSPEENAFILDVSCETIKKARIFVTGLSQREIYDKIREETKYEINKLELDLLVQKELQTKMETTIKGYYENKLKELELKNEDLSNKVSEYILNNGLLVQQEVNKEKDKIEKILEYKNNQVLRLTENYESLLKNMDTKSSKKLGDEGEDTFMDLSETFKDFIGYKIENKSHQGHKGDFHLFFEKFNVLVDLKNYSSPVQKKEIDKIEHDLSINDTMDFAWLISYKSNVCDWNKFPIMCKWIVTDMGLKCIIIVNKFNSNQNPSDMLRIIWNITNEIHGIVSKTKEIDSKDTEDEIKKIRERDYNILQKIKTTQKRLSEMKRANVIMTQTLKDTENDIIDIVSMFTNELTKNEYNKSYKIKEWWNDNIIFNDNNENKLTSTDIWYRFKKENKLYVDENKLLVDEFKNYIKNFIDVNNYTEKSKKGSIEFIGFRFKDLLVSNVLENVKVEENLEVELNITNVPLKKKKIKQGVKIVINEDIDKSIVEQYNDEDLNILELSKKNNMLVWQVVSILVNRSIIGKRSDARGYELYKETEDYKSKIIK
jgi:hypothetical protein